MKYDKLFSIISEYHLAQQQQLPAYDPCGYAKDDREKRREAVETALENEFSLIVLEIMSREQNK